MSPATPTLIRDSAAAGPHYCLGAGLARLELRLLIEETVDRVPPLELAGPPDRVRSALLNALHSLPVRPA